MNQMGVRPSFATGFAQWPGMSEHPELWRGLVAAYDPSLGQTGDRLIDWSGKGNDGTFGGSPTWGSGLYGSVIDWNGDSSYVNCGNLGHPSAFTLIAWIKITDYDNGYQSIIARGYFGANPCSYHLCYRIAGNEFNCFSRDSSTLKYLRTTDDRLILNQWHMVAVVWGTNVPGALYIDGRNQILVNQDAYNGTDVGYNTYLGKTDIPSNQGMIGSMSHAMVYNRALLAAEINLLYQLRRQVA